MDERRRRRLAAAEGTAADCAESNDGEEKSLPDCVPAEWCAVAPWIPRSPWKLWTLTALFVAGVAAMAFLTWRTPEFRAELAPAIDPLFRGSHPKLINYLETIFWTLSGQLALLIGWHRSRSRLDFRGRYRIWPWAAAMMFACGLCVATDLHLGIGLLLGQWELFARQPAPLAWILPATCLLLPVALLIDCDVRRSAVSVVLLRSSVFLMLYGAAASCYGSRWFDQAAISLTELVCGLFGPSLLLVALWSHGWYVAYVTPDPPASSPWRLWLLPIAALRWLLGWLTWPFRRRTVAEPAAATRRRKKSEEGTTTTRRRRKPKRKTRTRTKVVEEEAEEEDDAEEETADAEEESADEETGEEESYEEEESEPEPPPTRVNISPAPAASKSNNWREADQRSGQSEQRWNAPPQNSRPQSDDEDEDDDGEQWRADGPSPDQLKGLSKRQRRALIKQYRDQQRAARDK